MQRVDSCAKLVLIGDTFLPLIPQGNILFSPISFSKKKRRGSQATPAITYSTGSNAGTLSVFRQYGGRTVPMTWAYCQGDFSGITGMHRYIQ